MSFFIIFFSLFIGFAHSVHYKRMFCHSRVPLWGFPGSLVVKNLPGKSASVILSNFSLPGWFLIEISKYSPLFNSSLTL